MNAKIITGCVESAECGLIQITTDSFLPVTISEDSSALEGVGSWGRIEDR
jgi:hypothetical protein